MKKFLSKFWLCKIIGLHEWTTNAQKYPHLPTPPIANIIDFYEWSRMYCDRCGCESEVWREHYQKKLNDYANKHQKHPRLN